MEKEFDSSSKPLILVADDSATVRKVLEGILLEAGYRILSVASGHQAISSLGGAPIDLILLDIVMKDMDGYETCRKIKAHPFGKDVPVLFLSAKSSGQDVSKGFEAGAEDYIPKPFDKSELLARVKAQLKLRAITRQDDSYRNRVMDLINAIPAGIAICDANGCYTDINAGLLSMLNTPGSDLVGSNAIASTHESDKSRSYHNWKSLIKGDIESFKQEIRLLRKDGSYFWVDDVAKIINSGDDGEPKSIVEIVLDISERKSVESLKENVDRIIRHDLKAPIGEMISIVDLLEHSLHGITPDGADLLLTLRQTGHRLLDMITTSLKIQQIEDGGYKIAAQEIYLDALLREIANEFKGTIDIKKLHVRLDASTLEGHGVHIYSERLLCRTVFSNIIKNAVEAAPRGSEIFVQTSSSNGRVTVTVKNSGAVPKEIRDRFFDKYASSGKKYGTGLGNYTAKLITESLGGMMRMETSDISSCTTVSVDLPMNPL